MAKQIEWTTKALEDRKGILHYYRRRNRSTYYSRRLNNLFEKEIRLISEHPQIGKASNSKNVRVKVAGNYYIIYSIGEDTIYVLRIWDTRQNPVKLGKKFHPK